MMILWSPSLKAYLIFLQDQVVDCLHVQLVLGYRAAFILLKFVLCYENLLFAYFEYTKTKGMVKGLSDQVAFPLRWHGDL